MVSDCSLTPNANAVSKADWIQARTSLLFTLPQLGAARAQRDGQHLDPPLGLRALRSPHRHLLFPQVRVLFNGHPHSVVEEDVPENHT